MSIKVNLNKAKEIAHAKRRLARNEKFKPLDVEATIPAKANAAEAARQTIRDTDAATQINIDSAVDVDSLVLIMNTL